MLTLQNLKLGGNLEFSWYSCNILRYCSNRCIVWFSIPAICQAQANRKFPVQLYVKIQIIFEPPFWICKYANHLSFLAMRSLGLFSSEAIHRAQGGEKMLGGCGNWKKKWAIETHFPKFKWIIYDFNNNRNNTQKTISICVKWLCLWIYFRILGVATWSFFPSFL